MNRTVRTLMAGALLFAPAFGYTRLVDSTGTPLRRVDTKGIQYYINSGIVPGAMSSAISVPVKVMSDNSDPVTAIRDAFAAWSNLPGVDLKFLPLKSTDSFRDFTDGKHVIAFARNADDLTALGFRPGGAIGVLGLAVTASYPAAGQAADGTLVEKGDIADADIILNASGVANGVLFSTDGSTGIDFQAVMTHEIGHALGQNHSVALGATMFPFSAIFTQNGYVPVYGQRLVSSDDRQFAASVYPAANASLGTLAGKVTLGGNPAKNVPVTFIDTTTGVLVNTITGADGSYSQKIAPGDYLVYSEPYSLVQPGNLYLSASDVTTGFLPTFVGGNATPTTTKVTAGASATADLALTAGTSTLTTPSIAIGGAARNSDITSLLGIAGPMTLASGQALDIGLLGGGVDATTTVRIYGAGMTVRTGTTRTDTTVNFGANPLIRTTVDIAAREATALATMVLTKGTSVIVLTGYFVVVPRKPVFTSKSVVNAASYVGLNGDGVVSPGGLYSIYAATGGALGPAAFVSNGPYDGYGKLANNLGNVSVTFDGVPAPMFLSFSGQLNVQVPFEVAGKRTTQVQINYNGSLSDKITVPVVASQPAFFTFTPAAADSLAFGGPEYNLNTVTNATARGQVVVMYGTGLGKLSYDVPTGTGAGAAPAGYTGGNNCSIGGTKTVPAAYTGWVFGFVGLAQWNIAIPADSPTGKVTITCTDPNGNSTQTGTLYIK